jgi:hypothetical protein
MKRFVAILILTIILIAGCTQTPSNYQNDTNILEDPEEECVRVGGTWRWFSNGCVDSCSMVRSKESVTCTAAGKISCDCGPDRCWNERTCEPN